MRLRELCCRYMTGLVYITNEITSSNVLILLCIEGKYTLTKMLMIDCRNVFLQPNLHVLYLFAGAEKIADLKFFLLQ